MEELFIDRKSFFEFLETLFNRIDPVNRVTFKVDTKKGYWKIDNDYYKCAIEGYSLVYENKKEVFLHNLISSMVKHNGFSVVGRERKFDTSLITLEEIIEIINNNYKDLSFLHRLPDVINSINVDENFIDSDNSKVLVIDDKLKDVICDNMVDYLKVEEEAFSNLQTNLFYETKNDDNVLYMDLYKKNMVRK